LTKAHTTARNSAAFVAALAVAFAVALAMSAAALAQGGEAQVRVAHLASDAPNVDIYVNDAPVPELTNVPYGTVSPYLPLPAGTQNVKVYAAGDTSAPVIEADVDLAGGAAYTVGAVGLVSDGSLAAQVYEDDLSSPAEGNSSLRVIHASPDAGPVDVVPEGGEALVSGLEFPNASPYAEVPAGTYTLNVNAAGTDQTAIQVPDATVESGGVYSAFAVGTAAAGNLDVILTADSAATGDALPHTGGGSSLLAPLGAATVLAGAGLFFVRRYLPTSR
jgi:LPXTG-motif cell wall-anchored protein